MSAIYSNISVGEIEVAPFYSVVIHDEVGDDGGTNTTFIVGSESNPGFFTDADKELAVHAFADSLASGPGRSVYSIEKSVVVKTTL